MKFYCNKNQEIFKTNDSDFQKYDVILYGFNGIKKISYKSELNGNEDTLAKLIKLSKTTKKIFLVATVTDNYGLLKKSVIIAENGKILGISDMNIKLNNSTFSISGGYRVYQTSMGKIGILICDDILDYEGVKAMTICDADIIVILSDESERPEYNFIIRAYSYLFGVPILLMSSTGILASDISGEIVSTSRDNICEIVLPTKKTFRLITTKKRGLKKE